MALTSKGFLGSLLSRNCDREVQVPMLPRRAEATAPGPGGGLMSSGPTWSGAALRTELAPASHRVNMSPGADQDGSGEAATSSGVCLAHRGETLVATWPAPGPSSWPELPRTAGAIVVAGTRTLPGDWLPTSCPPSQNRPQSQRTSGNITGVKSP